MPVAIHIRPASSEDAPAMDKIRVAAFRPVFASFRSLLGDELYELAQAGDDAGQRDLLMSMLQPGSPWSLHVAVKGAEVVGFVSVRCDAASGMGEIGLNAVDPGHSGEGIGTQMYEFALEQMRAAGMRVATVSTGGDPSHEPARRAYRKAGFLADVPSVWMCRKL
jgi:ribosomal protein S18 acetylase RimI-like enzyme